MSDVQPDVAQHDNFDAFATTMNEIAINRFTEISQSGEQVHLIRARHNVMDVFLSGFSNEARQEYHCRECARFMNGIGSFAFIAEDLSIQPLAFDPSFSIGNAFPHFQGAWETLLEYFKDARNFNIVTVASLAQLEDIEGRESCGGYSHFALPVDHTTVRAFLESNAVDTTTRSHGFGEAEIQLTREHLNALASRFEDDVELPIEKLRTRDAEIVSELIETASAYAASDRNAFVLKYLIQGNVFIAQRMNTVAGTFLKDLMAGLTLQAALDRYQGFIDPRKYKRPVRLPSESEFEVSTTYLIEQGYDVELPTRLATMDEVRDLSTWSKKEGTAEKPSIFDEVREKLQVQPKLECLEEEPISLMGLKGVLTDLINRDVLRNIRFAVNGHYAGTIVTTVSETGGRIYKDGKRQHLSILSEPITPIAARDLYAKKTDQLDALIIEDDEFGYPLFTGITPGSWLIPLPPAVFADDLIGELYEHRHSIEHWSKSTFINTDEEGNVIPYEDVPVVTLLSVGNMAIVETDTTQYTFRITSVR